MIYKCWMADETSANAENVEAGDEQAAAEAFCDSYEWRNADFRIVGGDEATVWVCTPSGVCTKFTVSGYSVRHYDAKRVP